ncbi:Leucine-rich repeat receptor-like serine/threonine/tyrosine-protein kinase sobir1 [Sarracenia purpurea var. burkii]
MGVSTNHFKIPPPTALPVSGGGPKPRQLAMASVPGKPSIHLLSLVALLVVVQAKLNLDRSEHDTLLSIQRDFGLNGQRRQDMETPCNSAAGGVFCQRRIWKDAYTLRVTQIVLNSRQLTGFLSPAIGLLSELKELALQNNQLVGQIPPQIIGCRNLEILNLRNNQFAGKVPGNISSLIHLRVLDLSSNKFSGNLNFLKHFPNLEELFLADNMFSGKVPASLQSFRNLRFFDVSGNSFLQGPVPVMERVEFSSKRYVFAENSRLTNQASAMAPSPASQKSSTGPVQAPSPTTPTRRHKRRLKPGSMILGFLAGALAGSLSGLVFTAIFKLLMILIKGGQKNAGPSIFSPLIKKAEDLAFLEKEDGLASLELIGRGGCGEVYKAELPGSNGKMLAIKKVIQPPRDAADLTQEDSKLLNKKMRQIRSEIQTVGQIRHRNLIPLLAHVSKPDCHYLVYEFMKNGSLQDILNQVSAGNRELDWLSRHRIAAGVAAGLEYLHMGHSPRIIHRDLKPANILLDDDMEARIADFGLAKAVPDANTHVTTSNVAGTVGYIAPEYHQTLKFTDRCDIYSFGVLLGVLVIGKLPSDDFFQHTPEMSLVKWMRNVMTSEDPKRAIDTKLIGNGYEEQMLLVLKIACFCTLEDPKQRPNSKDVRCMLTQIKP